MKARRILLMKPWRCAYPGCRAVSIPLAAVNWGFDPDTRKFHCDRHNAEAVKLDMIEANQCRNCSSPIVDGVCSYTGRSPDEPAPYHGPSPLTN